MNFEETAMVLAKIASADQRTVGDADILFWSEVIPDHIEVRDALAGVTVYFRNHRERIMPTDLITAARRARCTRTGERMWTE